MAYIIENLEQYDLNPDEIEKLTSLGLIVKSDEHLNLYELTALVWNDLGLEGERAYVLLDIILGRKDDDPRSYIYRGIE